MISTIFEVLALHGAEHKTPRSISGKIMDEQGTKNQLTLLEKFRSLKKRKGISLNVQPSSLERRLSAADHHEQHEVAQKHFLVLLSHNLEQSGQRNYDIPEACQHKVALLKYHFHTLF